MEREGKILIVDDNEDVLLSLNMLLKPYVEAVRVINKPERIIEFMDNFMPDVIMLDMNFSRDAISGEEGYEWLQKILKHNPQSVVLFITAYVDTEKAVRAIKAGAVDFIPKPWDKTKLLDTVKSAVELSKNRQGNRNEVNVPAMDDAFSTFIGECPEIQKIKKQIARIAVTDTNVLITGENGTGKDVVAHAIHRLSQRSEKPFVCIDLGCIPEALFESELFGYEKGAFTDARTQKAGRMETADGGTLFLDEIGNLTMQMQQKLLTAIEKKEVVRVGAQKAQKVDMRIVSATNANLQQRVYENTFRQDLLYRIDTIELHLPPLRERGSDIILLAEHFAKKITEKYGGEAVMLDKDACKKLMSHPWHGNVRELQHCMERSIVMSGKPVLTADDIALGDTSPEKGESRTEQAVPLNLEELERQTIRRAVAMSNGNLTQAAELLGITRFALYRKIDKLGI